jgi:hypothetical protein
MNPRERAKHLVELATDLSTTEHESRTAAVAAARLIKEHKLLDPVPAAPTPMPGGASGHGFVWRGEGPGAMESLAEFLARMAVHTAAQAAEQVARAAGASKRTKTVTCNHYFVGGTCVHCAARQPKDAKAAPKGKKPSDLEIQSRIAAVAEDLRQRAPGMSGEQIHRAAVAAVHEELRREGWA